MLRPFCCYDAGKARVLIKKKKLSSGDEDSF